MTVPTTNSRMDYVGDGVTTVFPYTFKIPNDGSIEVRVLSGGVESIKVLTTDYSVSGAGSVNGGDVAFGVAPAAGDKVVLRRSVGMVQETDLKNQGAFYPEIHEDALDKITMLLQQQQEQLDRAVTVPVTGGATPETYLAELDALVAAFVAGSADMSAGIHGATNKAALVGADEFSIWNSITGLIGKISYANFINQLNGLFAALAGSVSQVFSVGDATAPEHAVNLGVADARYPQGMFPANCTMASNALTASLAACGLVKFRNPTAATGTPVSASISAALSLSIPATSNLGMPVSGSSNKLAIALAYNGGTPVMMAAISDGGLQLDERNLVSPTTIGAASNTINTWYSASAVSANSPYRILAVVDAVFTTGTGWSAPSNVQPAGDGVALSSLFGFGYTYGQTTANVLPSRAVNTTYYNRTLRPKEVTISALITSGSSANFMVNGASVLQDSGLVNSPFHVNKTILPGENYSLNTTGTPTIQKWSEN